MNRDVTIFLLNRYNDIGENNRFLRHKNVENKGLKKVNVKNWRGMTSLLSCVYLHVYDEKNEKKE